MRNTNFENVCRIAALSIGAGLGAAVLGGLSQPGKGKDAEPWIAPARAAKKQNPIAADAKSLDLGKKLFERDCASCHGAKGLGDGPKAGELEKRPASFADPSIWDQSDGAFFWKITEGKAPMPSEKTLMTEDERWHVINYMHTLAPPEAIPTPPQYAVPETHRKAISAVLKGYEPVRTALAGKGDGSAAAKAIPALADAAGMLSKTDAAALPEGAKSSWPEDAAGLDTSVGSLKSAGQDVTKLREGLVKASAALTRLVERYGHAEGGPVLLFGTDGSQWLQTDAKGQDPYGRADAGASQKPTKRFGAQKKS